MKRTAAALLCALAVAIAPLPAGAEEDLPADLPVLSGEARRGTAIVTATAPVQPTTKVVDGAIQDWTGTNPRFAGFATYSKGELVYQDYLFDGYGEDSGDDYERTFHDEAQAVVGETYRAEALQRKDVPGEFGAPNPAPASMHHGDYPQQAAHDLQELRFASTSGGLDVLARTTNMTSATQTGLLLLIDSAPGSERRDVPFNSGLVTDIADHAVLVHGHGVSVATLATGEIADVGDQAIQPDGWTNAVETRIPLGAIGVARGSSFSVVGAVGPLDESGKALLKYGDTGITNVAFRGAEPVRAWFDRLQAYSLYEHDIDRFAYEIDTAKLESGYTEDFRPGSGYHEKVFRSSDVVSTENGLDGIYQHYGVYVPTAYDGEQALPLQWWLHWRGGTAHEGAAVTPRIFKHFGEQQDTIVISPRGRGTGTWYVGEGHVDVLQVFDDIRSTLEIDENRVYTSGHSMGGWGSYLLAITHPDWFAAAAPFAGPVTQGAWTGVDFDGCDEFQFEEYTPCYISANGSDPRAQHTRRILENVLHIPFAVFHGTDDELVPVSGVTRQVERFVQLGYRHRYYLSPGYEHYTHPAMDEWTEAARYEHQFVRDPNPARVIFFRDMPFERATETVQANGATLDFTFDRAYWMSGLTAVDETAGVARFDGTSLALGSTPHLAVPDSGAPTAPGQAGPYVITGMQWIVDPTSAAPAASNGFRFTLTGARAVQLDVARMGLDTTAQIAGTITSDNPFELKLQGAWSSAPIVTLGGQSVSASYSAGVLTILVPAGTSQSLLIG